MGRVGWGGSSASGNENGLFDGRSSSVVAMTGQAKPSQGSASRASRARGKDTERRCASSTVFRLHGQTDRQTRKAGKERERERKKRDTNDGAPSQVKCLVAVTWTKARTRIRKKSLHVVVLYGEKTHPSTVSHTRLWWRVDKTEKRESRIVVVLHTYNAQNVLRVVMPLQRRRTMCGREAGDCLFFNKEF